MLVYAVEMHVWNSGPTRGVGKAGWSLALVDDVIHWDVESGEQELTWMHCLAGKSAIFSRSEYLHAIDLCVG